MSTWGKVNIDTLLIPKEGQSCQWPAWSLEHFYRRHEGVSKSTAEGCVIKAVPPRAKYSSRILAVGLCLVTEFRESQKFTGGSNTHDKRSDVNFHGLGVCVTAISSNSLKLHLARKAENK